MQSRDLIRFRKALDSDNDAVRRQAVIDLDAQDAAGWPAVPAATVDPLVSSLRRLLSSRNGAQARSTPFIQQHVASILGKIGTPSQPAVPELIPLLRPEFPAGVREATVKALAAIGKGARAAVPELLKLLTPECHIKLAMLVARALGDIGCSDQKVKSALVNLWMLPLSGENGRHHVAHALCKLRIEAPGLVESLVRVIMGPSKAGDRIAAVEALSWGRKDAVGVVPAVVLASSDENEDVRRTAQGALERLGVSSAKSLLICCEQLASSPPAAAALRKSGAAAVKGLIQALASKEPGVREQAARTLGDIGEPAAAAADALSTLLKDKDSAVRLAGAKALWKVAKQANAVVPVLAGLLNGKNVSRFDSSDLRRGFLQTVIEALHRIGPLAKEAVPALVATTRDENRLVRESASRALAVINVSVPESKPN